MSYDLAGVQKYKSDVVDKNAAGVTYLMKKNKVTVFNGFGKIAGKGKVEVALDGGKKETIDTKNIIIATGSVVRPIPGFETDGKQVVNSDQILELQNVPKSMIVMGSGAVGVEFASVYSRFGCDTTVVELLDRIVPLEDAEVSKELARCVQKAGHQMRDRHQDRQARKDQKGRQSFRQRTQKAKTYPSKPKCCSSPSAECLISKISASKTPKSSSIRAARSRSTNTAKPTSRECFAIGDVIDTAWLAHLASKEGIMVVEKIAGKKVEPINQNLVPNCTYCDPEVAASA